MVLDSRSDPSLRSARLALIGVAAGLWGACSETEKVKPRRPPALVSVAAVEDGTIEQRWSTLGRVTARARAEVSVGASGAVTKVTAQVGQKIRKGETLVEVDPTLAAAQVEVASAELETLRERLAQARRDLGRSESLAERSAVSLVEVERARSAASSLASELKAREAQLREVRAQYRQQFVRAPFDGVVAGRFVDPGDWVTAGTPVLELVSSASPYVLVDVGAELLASIEVGMTAELAGAGKTVAKVAARVNALDPITRTAPVRLEILDPPAWLLPGGTVSAVFQLAASDSGVVVSRDAVLETQERARVFKIVEQRAESMQVRVLARGTDKLLVAGDGLQVGDQVVVRGNERLRDGQTVKLDSVSANVPAPPSVATPEATRQARGG